jgi:ring-1,2-phenylacetyl-CoA epoxidase subunit PaaD
MSEPSARASIDTIWSWLRQVPDPEIPVISVVDLGIVRGVRWEGVDQNADVVVTVTPTYSGCPATEVIAASIRDRLAVEGIERSRVETQLAPAWTTDWLGPEAKEKLRQYGIAPPAGRADEHVIDISRLTRRPLKAAVVACPRCGTTHTQVISAFGSTPCKSLHRCDDCHETFDYFKPH